MTAPDPDAPRCAMAADLSALSDRLVKLCGLLGSAHDGERATAAAMADQLLRQNKLTWVDVIAIPKLLPPPPEHAPPARVWQEPKRKRGAPECLASVRARYLIATWFHLLSTTERSICQSIVSQRTWTSKKQGICLSRMLARCRKRAGAGHG
jgi:hypothetical protein